MLHVRVMVNRERLYITPGPEEPGSSGLMSMALVGYEHQMNVWRSTGCQNRMMVPAESEQQQRLALNRLRVFIDSGNSSARLRGWDQIQVMHGSITAACPDERSHTVRWQL